MTLVLREKSYKIFSVWKNKEDTGVPVYIKIHKRNKETGTQTLFIFYKIQIQVPYICALHSMLPLDRSNLGDVVF